MMLTILAVEAFVMLSLGYIQVTPEKTRSGRYKYRFNDNVIRIFSAMATVVTLSYIGENLGCVIDILTPLGWVAMTIVIIVGFVILGIVVFWFMFRIAKVGNDLFPPKDDD